MILSENDVEQRMTSPLNLLNRLRLATNRTNPIPSVPPDSSDIIPDIDNKIAYGGLKSKAASVMMKAMNELDARIEDIQRPEKLAAIAADMSKIVNGSNSNGNQQNVQVVIYQPRMSEEQDYESLVVNE